MQIKPAVLLAVLSASAASAIKLALFDGKNCNGNWVGDHNVYEHGHRYSLPMKAWSAYVSDNPNSDVIRLFEGKGCFTANLPSPGDAIDNVTGGCLRGKLWDETIYTMPGEPY
ncbi:hypothetical protein BD779DRAFT_1567154 [Infundibulicybe gibba]|nr:hypothetical protein BD779DRAFT_1567154 [Infundibulicybe gibba]